MSTYQSESAEILAAKARLETAKKFVQCTTANEKKAVKDLRDARSALQAARTELVDAEACLEATEKKWDETNAVMKNEISDRDCEVSFSDVEELTDNGKKRAAESPAEERQKKKARKSTKGKPPRKCLISKVPAIEVNGCGVEEANGIYWRDGEMNGYPKFSRRGKYCRTDGTYKIERNAFNSWAIIYNSLDRSSVDYTLYVTRETDWLQNNPTQNEWKESSYGWFPLPDLTIY